MGDDSAPLEGFTYSWEDEVNSDGVNIHLYTSDASHQTVLSSDEMRTDLSLMQEKRLDTASPVNQTSNVSTLH